RTWTCHGLGKLTAIVHVLPAGHKRSAREADDEGLGGARSIERIRAPLGAGGGDSPAPPLAPFPSASSGEYACPHQPRHGRRHRTLAACASNSHVTPMHGGKLPRWSIAAISTSASRLPRGRESSRRRRRSPRSGAASTA